MQDEATPDVSKSAQKPASKNIHDHHQDYFDPGPVPKNVYDRGLKENWKEVFFPISKRKDALSLGGYSRPPPRQTQGPNRKEAAAESRTSQAGAHSQLQAEEETAGPASLATTTSSKTKFT